MEEEGQERERQSDRKKTSRELTFCSSCVQIVLDFTTIQLQFSSEKSRKQQPLAATSAGGIERKKEVAVSLDVD